MRSRAGELNRIALSEPSHSKFAHRVEDWIGDRADMRMNSPEIAQDVEMERLEKLR